MLEQLHYKLYVFGFLVPGFKFSQSVITQSRGSSAARPEDSDTESGRGLGSGEDFVLRIVASFASCSIRYFFIPSGSPVRVWYC